MEKKDYILIVISSTALIISITSLIITLVQKNKEVKRTIRKTLSDTLEGIARINIEVTKSRGEDFNSEKNILLRRNYNTQRHILIAHADTLVQNYDSIVKEIDCKILAEAHSSIGDYDAAKIYWEKATHKSQSGSIKMMTLRGYAMFLFGNGEVEEGRKIFNEAINIKLKDTDENKIILADTYLMLCDMEKGIDTDNFESSLLKAMEIWHSIKNKNTKEDIYARINLRRK
ncbi:MAG: hypothetical protein M0D57_18950 [Sphingobacteriales bacterium JAD_PAG50586_3]|nr:MAG: hypothetical protein M0D57_18950 [Sphingobacteriales bacterium JAD_PAG50586_3]